jgi:hypothetical protein
MECFILTADIDDKGMVTLSRDGEPEPGGPFPRAILRRQMSHYLLSDDQLDKFEVALDGGHRAQVDVKRVVPKFSV